MSPVHGDALVTTPAGPVSARHDNDLNREVSVPVAAFETLICVELHQRNTTPGIRSSCAPAQMEAGHAPSTQGLAP